jgi:hypothetical protein
MPSYTNIFMMMANSAKNWESGKLLIRQQALIMRHFAQD